MSAELDLINEVIASLPTGHKEKPGLIRAAELLRRELPATNEIVPLDIRQLAMDAANEVPRDQFCPDSDGTIPMDECAPCVAHTVVSRLYPVIYKRALVDAEEMVGAMPIYHGLKGAVSRTASISGIRLLAKKIP